MAWCSRTLDKTEPETYQLVEWLVMNKAERIDDFSENKITCYIADEEELSRTQQIPRYVQHPISISSANLIASRV